jgi:iron complex outermembrane recepter protein
MNMYFRLTPLAGRLALARVLSCALAPCVMAPALAQGVATEAELTPVLTPVTVTGQRARLAPQVPATTASKTAEDLRKQNLFNPEDALQYAPNTTVRKRYLGDRNALIAGRSFGTLQPSRALVYVDGYLTSNFLGRFDAPRWNMISPEAIERVDLLYGPYSALYPGNSIGTTVAVSQSQPKGFELSGRVIANHQSFKQYGQKDNFDGHQVSLHLGQKLESGLWFAGDLNHQDSTSQPMSYYAVSANASGVFPVAPGSATAVTGIVYDTDPKGLKRAVFGTTGEASDHTVQDTLNLRAGYRFTPVIEASGMLSWWHNNTDTSARSFLRDASGAVVNGGVVTDGSNTFNLPWATFAPSARDETHQQLGLTLKTRHAAGWNTSLVVSDYRILDDVNHQSAATAANDPKGTATRRDGTGWNTLEVQGVWTPTAGDWTGGAHTVALGMHRNGYKLDNTVDTVNDWRQSEGTLSQYFRGKTEVLAGYGQDTWRFAPDWRLTAGLRLEQFKARSGEQLAAGNSVVYPERKLYGTSPKLALAWALQDDLTLKLSAGRGVRFPNVEELYNGTVTALSVTLSDPKLVAERSDAIELSAEQAWERHRLRVSLFQDDVKDAILRQSTTDATVCKSTAVASSYTCVQNVDRVKTYGVELAWQAQDWLLQGLGIDANFAYAHSKVTANSRDPLMVGKYWLRVPRTRGNVMLSWRPKATNSPWMSSLGFRHEGRAYNDTYNADINPNVYGGVSKVRQLDARLAYTLSRQLELAGGVNNLTDAYAYQAHPYPGRTLFAELRFKH